jgi:membrane-bound ClpP family serine protease
MDVVIVIVLLLVGIILILSEIFLLPGITFAAIGGALFGIGGIAYAYAKLGPTGGTITLICSLIVFGAAFIWLIKSKTLDRIALKTDIKSTVADKKLMDTIKEGDMGITISRLNPMGKVKVNNMTVEAKTLGDFVDDGVEVVVLKVSPTQITVTLKE